MSAIIVTLFLGGPAGPALDRPGLAVGPSFWFFLKLLVLLFVLRLGPRHACPVSATTS